MKTETDSIETQQRLLPPPSPPKGRKGYKGVPMEGYIARWYSKIQQKSIDQYRSWAKMACGYVSEGAAILEIAPGPGYLSIEMARLDSYRIVGLDISKTFVKIATEKARAANVQVEFRQGDAAYMPFSADMFDLAICTSAFKNFPEPVKVLDEIYRILKKGGRAVVIDLNKNGSKKEIDEYVDQMKLGRINSFMTKFSFKHGLLKYAYTKNKFEEFVGESHFGRCTILESGISLQVCLEKDHNSSPHSRVEVERR